jgi:putative transposase
MNHDNVIAFQPVESSASFRDALSELVRQGVRQIIAQAVEAALNAQVGIWQGKDRIFHR